MKLLALTERKDHVCFRYRIGAFRDAIERAGGSLCEMPLARDAATRMTQLRAVRDADVVILQRRFLPLWQLWILRRWSRALVYDFDDAVFRRSSLSHRRSESWSRRRGFRSIVRAADLVIAGNSFLEQVAAQHIPAERVRRIPTCVDVRKYPVAAHQDSGSAARLVWIGQRSTLRYLGDARQRLAAVAARVRGIALRVISDEFPTDCGVPVNPCSWSQMSEAEDLASCDVGISWLSDDDWSRGKCGLKLLQYMAAGLPVVANPVGTSSEMVVHGKTGFLASTPEEWAAAVEVLVNDPAKRRAMGAAGRRRAEECYGVDRWASAFTDEMRELCKHDRDMAGTRDSDLQRTPLGTSQLS